MNFKTIWTLRGLPLKERLLRTRDWAAIKVAVNLPVRVRYWSAVCTMAGVSTKPPLDTREPMGITVEEVMTNMDRPKVIA